MGVKLDETDSLDHFSFNYRPDFGAKAALVTLSNYLPFAKRATCFFVSYLGSIQGEKGRIYN